MDWVHFPITPLAERHLVANSILVFLTLIIVALRIVSRFLSGAKLWWDDYLILLAIPQGIGMLVIQGMWTTMGMGHLSRETLPNLMSILKMLIAYELVFSTTLTTVKLSVLSFYLRLFVNKGLRLAVKLTLAFVLLWTVGNVLQVFLICRPFVATYDITVKGVCGNQVASYIAIGCFNVVTDLIILMLPMSTVWALQMPKPAKLALTGVFLMGLLVTIVAIVRIEVLASELHMDRLTETMEWAAFWSAFEVNLAILCVSTPMLGALWSRCTTRPRLSAKFSKGFSFDHTRASAASGPPSSSKSKLSMKKRRPREEDEELALESIYASNQQVHYESAAACARKESVDQARFEPTDSSLSTLVPEPKASSQDIKVYTKWTITHDRMQEQQSRGRAC